jgi:hypothetical protein
MMAVAIQRLMDDWEELWQVNVPAALTIHPNAFKPRSIALPDIARAYDRLDIETWELSDLALTGGSGLSGSPTRVAGLKENQAQTGLPHARRRAPGTGRCLDRTLGPVGAIRIMTNGPIWIYGDLRTAAPLGATA